MQKNQNEPQKINQMLKDIENKIQNNKNKFDVKTFDAVFNTINTSWSELASADKDKVCKSLGSIFAKWIKQNNKKTACLEQIFETLKQHQNINTNRAFWYQLSYSLTRTDENIFSKDEDWKIKFNLFSMILKKMSEYKVYDETCPISNMLGVCGYENLSFEDIKNMLSQNPNQKLNLMELYYIFRDLKAARHDIAENKKDDKENKKDDKENKKDDKDDKKHIRIGIDQYADLLTFYNLKFDANNNNDCQYIKEFLNWIHTALFDCKNFAEASECSYYFLKSDLACIFNIFNTSLSKLRVQDANDENDDYRYYDDETAKTINDIVNCFNTNFATDNHFSVSFDEDNKRIVIKDAKNIDICSHFHNYVRYDVMRRISRIKDKFDTEICKLCKSKNIKIDAVTDEQLSGIVKNLQCEKLSSLLDIYRLRDEFKKIAEKEGLDLKSIKYDDLKLNYNDLIFATQFSANICVDKNGRVFNQLITDDNELNNIINIINNLDVDNEANYDAIIYWIAQSCFDEYNSNINKTYNSFSKLIECFDKKNKNNGKQISLEYNTLESIFLSISK